jgi:hypothetical protein
VAQRETRAGPRAIGPWLTLDEYKAFARIDVSDTTDDAAITEAVTAASGALELRARLAFAVDEVGDPIYPVVPAEVHEAGLLLANRLLARRNSPDGVVGVADMGTARVASYDADISALVGPYVESVLA